MSVASRVVLVGTIVAASMSVVVPAQAAAKACVLGKWRSTSYHMTIENGVGQTYAKGAKGVRLTITRTSLAYDFNKSTKETLTGFSSGSLIFRSSYQYAKKLRVKATVKGAKKGSIVIKSKTATGNATGTGRRTWPERKNLGTYNMAKSLRSGSVQSLVPVKSDFSCSGKTLKFFSSVPYNGYMISIGRVFTRA